MGVTQRVVIVGSGAAGTAAAAGLAEVAGVTTTLVARTGETPRNRMYVKGVAHGRLQPAQLDLPLPAVEVVRDTAQRVDVNTRTLALASGRVLDYDALVVATGCEPVALPSTVPGAVRALADGTMTTYFSVEDAVRIRAALAGHDGGRRIVIYGAGFTAAEAAAAMRADGHRVSLVARSAEPGRRAFGDALAAELARAHRAHVDTYFGRTIAAIEREDGATRVVLDDGVPLQADLIIIAIGTQPRGVAPWAEGVVVDDRMRTDVPGVYAAGGAVYHRERTGGVWRIDHWDDSAAQGRHVAATLRHDLGLADDPGPYRPRSAFTAALYDRVVGGVGLTGGEWVDDADGETLLHAVDGALFGAAGTDEEALRHWSERLHLTR